MIADLHYIEGKITGEQTYFYSNGNILSKGEMINGKENGAWKFYNPNGELAGYVKYENGIQLDEQNKKK